MRNAIPWWGKIALKLILSRIPISYSHYSKVGLFRHGKMDDPRYALDIFDRHFRRADFPNKDGGFVALELGPGDSVVSAIMAQAYGAERCYMVDAGRYAVDEVETYRQIAERLRSEGVQVAAIDDCTTMEALLERVGGVYLTEGLESLKSLPAGSVDLIWSQAVMEHVRLAEFDATVEEQFRVLRPGGIASHRIDLKDHLGGSLNNLRFSEKVWEADWMTRSGFYTNRIRYDDMVQRFERAGFRVEILQADQWDAPPLPAGKLAEPFRSLSPEELRVSGFDVLLVKPS